MRLEEIIRRTGYSKRSIYRWIELEGFPKPWNEPRRPRRWREEEVVAWLREHGIEEDD